MANEEKKADDRVKLIKGDLLPADAKNKLPERYRFEAMVEKAGVETYVKRGWRVAK